jgi:hypothetical protein
MIRQYLRFAILLVTVLVASRQASEAQLNDTLKIRSLREINVCGSATEALLSIDLGEIYFADSLLSFDITLSYDTTYLRPGVALSSGTLSEQLSWMDGPLTNAVIPGEFRVFGASILTPAKGNLPLVALTMDAQRVVCGVSTPIELAYPADFNPEFRRDYSLWQGDSIRFVAKQTIRTDLGTSFDEDTKVLPGKDSISRVPFSVTLPSAKWQPMMVTLESSDPKIVVIDSLEIVGVLGVVTGEGAQASAEVSGSDTVVRGSAWIRQITQDSLIAEITAGVIATSCMCDVPAKADTLRLTTTSTVLSSAGDDDKADIDGGTEISIVDEMMTIQGDHEYPMIVRVYDVFGRILSDNQIMSPQHTVQVGKLPRGPYVITMETRGRTKRMMQWN